MGYPSLAGQPISFSVTQAKTHFLITHMPEDQTVAVSSLKNLELQMSLKLKMISIALRMLATLMIAAITP